MKRVSKVVAVLLIISSTAARVYGGADCCLKPCDHHVNRPATSAASHRCHHGSMQSPACKNGQEASAKDCNCRFRGPVHLKADLPKVAESAVVQAAAVQAVQGTIHFDIAGDALYPTETPPRSRHSDQPLLCSFLI